MSLVITPAVVLQTYRYSETSKVVRLATRELGIQSAIAKGVLRPKSRFGAALEFLSEGEAQLYYRDSRELHTLAAFDATNLRRGLAGDVARGSRARPRSARSCSRWHPPRRFPPPIACSPPGWIFSSRHPPARWTRPPYGQYGPW